MAKILYSVTGEGMGHAIRSHTIISELIKNHDIRITASDRAFPYLKERYGDIVSEIKGNTYVYEDNNVIIGKTLSKFLMNLPKNTVYNIKHMVPFVLDFKPDVVISDFEPASVYLSRLLNIPCISIDNIHCITECKHDIPPPFYVTTTIKTLNPICDYYIVTSIIDFKAKRPDKTVVVPPVIRAEIKEKESRIQDFILVYQTSKTNEKMLPVLEAREESFRIYGMGKRKDRKNITFHEFSEKQFIEDLRSCRYVIVNGGFTVISESLYLNKPVLCIPIGAQFEQLFNGICIQKHGLGAYTEELSKEDLDSFEAEIDNYRSNVKKLGRWEDSKLFRHLDEIFKRYA